MERCAHMKIKIIVMSKNEEKRAALIRMLQDEELLVISEVSAGLQALEKIENLNPDMFILDGSESADVFSVAERVYFNKPQCVLMLLTVDMGAPYLTKAMQAGIHNVFPWPDNTPDFVQKVKRVYTSESSHIAALSIKPKVGWASKVITIFGTKSGIGKTTLAVNLAVKLAEKKKKVALIDLDLQFGDASVFLNIEPKDTLSELIQDRSEFTIDVIRSYMIMHSSGVHVLCAPNSPEYAEIIKERHIESLLNTVRAYYDYVIVDTMPLINDVSLAAIEGSNQVLFVIGMDISILRNARLGLNLLEALHHKDKVQLVVNREVDGSISVEDIKKVLEFPIIARLPSEWKVAVASLNQGVPFVTGVKKSRLSAGITLLADQIIAESTIKSERAAFVNKKQ